MGSTLRLSAASERVLHVIVKLSTGSATTRSVAHDKSRRPDGTDAHS